METPAPPTSNDPRKSIGLQVESVARSVAALLAATYGIGFLILSIHEARFGILQFNPLKARILLVGFTFVFLAAVPVALRQSMLAHPGFLHAFLGSTYPSLRSITLDTIFVLSAFLIACLPHFMFSPILHVAGRRKWVELGFIVLLTLFLYGFQYYLAPMFVRYPKSVGTISLVVTLAILVALFVLDLQLGELAAWMGGIMLVASGFQAASNKSQYALAPQRWMAAGVLVFLYTLMFGLIPAEYGGGRLTPVTMYLRDPVSFMSAGPTAAFLVDETGEGFYVVASGGGKAYFIPRARVEWVYFGLFNDQSNASNP